MWWFLSKVEWNDTEKYVKSTAKIIGVYFYDNNKWHFIIVKMVATVNGMMDHSAKNGKRKNSWDSKVKKKCFFI